MEAIEETRKEEGVKDLKRLRQRASRKRGVWGSKESRGQWTHDWNHECYVPTVPEGSREENKISDLDHGRCI
jgi:hypothetical protein